MKQRFATLTAGLSVPSPMRDPEASFELLRIWRDIAPDTFPVRLDVQEPIRAPIDPDRIEDSRVKQFGVAWYATRRHPDLLFIFLRGAPQHHASIRLFFYDPPSPDLVAAISGLIDLWADHLAPDYGMVHSLCAAERTEATSEWRADVEADLTGGHVQWGFTPELRRGLPTLYWRNLLGRPYVDLIGRETLLSAPAFRVEERTWGVRLQLTSDPPADQSFDAFRYTREQVLDHIGRQFFISGASDALARPLYPDLDT